jgi:hypothetical protein
LGDCSDPASETKRPSAFKSEFTFMGHSMQATGWIVNHPPTAVGKNPKFSSPPM